MKKRPYHSPLLEQSFMTVEQGIAATTWQAGIGIQAWDEDDGVTITM